MNEDNRENIRTLLNEWWTIEDIPDEVRTVNVVLIFKEGDNEHLANYRPISLLNTFYKILAAIAQHRISIHMYEYPQKRTMVSGETEEQQKQYTIFA